MRKLSPLIIGLILVACNSNEKKAEESAKNTDWLQQNLKGKVQTLRESVTNLDSTGNAKNDSTTNIYDFDAKGYLAKFVTKDSSGKATFEQTITHNDNGTMKEVVNVKNGKQIYKLEGESDSSGNYTGGKTYDSTGKQDGYFTDLKTNEYGVVYAGKQHFMNGKVKNSFDMKYDKYTYVSGQSTDSLGRTDYKGSVKVDDKGNPVDEISTTLEKDSSKTEHMTYKYDGYDDKGNWLQQTTYDDKGKPTKIVKRSYTYYKD